MKNVIAVTARPRFTSNPIVDLSEHHLRPSTSLMASVTPKKRDLYREELEQRYKAEKKARSFLEYLIQLHERIHNAHTVYVLTAKGCEKWQMEGFKLFYNSVRPTLSELSGKK